MQVIGEDNPCVDFEWSFLSRLYKGLSQALKVIHQQPGGRVCQGDGEKYRSAGFSGAEVIRHERIEPQYD